jgi:hypothetical protein
MFPSILAPGTPVLAGDQGGKDSYLIEHLVVTGSFAKVGEKPYNMSFGD